MRPGASGSVRSRAATIRETRDERRGRLATIRRWPPAHAPTAHPRPRGSAGTPSPDLIGIDDEPASRPALDELGRAAWAAGSGTSSTRRSGAHRESPTDYAELRRTYYGADPRRPGRSGAGTDRPTPSADFLAEFTTRVAPHNLNAWHPRSLSYFTPPPLTMSIVGELLAQVTNQGVDVWHAGPIGAFVEEEVVRWLCDLVGYGAGSFGILTSGGVMANFIGDGARPRRAPAPDPRARPAAARRATLEGVRVYASDQTHFSIARALDELGFPPETLVVVPADERFRLRGAPVAEAIAEDRAAGLHPIAISAVAGSTNTGSVDLIERAGRRRRARGPVAPRRRGVRGGARLSPRDGGASRAWSGPTSVTVDPHKWFFQAYDIGGLLVRAATTCRRRSTPRARVLPRRRATGERRRRRRRRPRRGRAAQLLPARLEGTRRWRALKLWLCWKHLGHGGLRPARRGERRPGRLPRPARAPRRTISRRCRPSPSCRSCASATCRAAAAARRRIAASSMPTRIGSRPRSRPRATAGSTTTRLRGSTWLRAGIVNYLATEADIDRILDDLRRLARHEPLPDR